MEELYLKDICIAKKPICFNYCLDSACSKGNCSIIPYKNSTTYLASFREFYYSLYVNKNYRTEFKPSSKYWIWFCLLTNDFVPSKMNFNNVTVDFGEEYRDKFQIEKTLKNLEDYRLFMCNGNLYSSASLVKKGNIPQEAFLVFKMTDKNWKMSMDCIFHSEEMSNRQREKNWMNIPNTIKFIYEIKPKAVSVYDVQTKQMTEIPHEVEVPENLRGSTNLIQIGDVYVSLTHVRHSMLEYSNYFLVFDMNMTLKHVSRRFRFDRDFKVEIAMSMFNEIGTDSMGISVCEMDTFQYVYLFDRGKLLDFIYS